MDYSILRSVDYMCYEKFTWQVPFNLLEQPGLSWRTELHRKNQGKSVKIGETCTACPPAEGLLGKDIP